MAADRRFDALTDRPNICTSCGGFATLSWQLLSGVSMVARMVTARQIRAARALLGWSQQELADRAIVSLNALARLETGKADTRLSTVSAVEKALRSAGVMFLAAGQRGEGVRLSDPET